tara:strand:- start:377 stop:727 length:351 start_codon:yes stop_codon:yes gene_type:complete
MSLGNSMSMGQARGKAKATMVKRYKEINTAKNYTEILGTTVQGSSACALSLGSNTYCHDGSGTFPAVDDKVYSRKRANTKYYLANGHYKIHNASDTRTTKNIEISSGAVTRVTPCP